MGEYAMYKGQRIKIGTCEDMYYLRADQARLVSPQPGNVDPVRDATGIRFRFPFPDEDTTEPGAFDPYNRAAFLWTVRVPEGVEHYNIQFQSDAGYLVSLPCPESPGYNGPSFHRNGFRGYVGIRQQRVWEGKLVLVAECGGCNAAYRYPTLDDAAPVVDDCRAEGAKKGGSSGKWYAEIAERIVAGYVNPLLWEC